MVIFRYNRFFLVAHRRNHALILCTLNFKVSMEHYLVFKIDKRSAMQNKKSLTDVWDKSHLSIPFLYYIICIKEAAKACWALKLGL